MQGYEATRLVLRLAGIRGSLSVATFDSGGVEVPLGLQSTQAPSSFLRSTV
jgi:hypothetical protein